MSPARVMPPRARVGVGDRALALAIGDRAIGDRTRAMAIGDWRSRWRPRARFGDRAFYRERERVIERAIVIMQGLKCAFNIWSVFIEWFRL